MVEAGESDVQIILSIKEGKDFEQVLQPTILVGTLNGHSLKTDKIESSPNPQYDTDLIWETNKITMRKMRSGQASLKLECYAFKENENKEKIGHVLLSLRSAHLAYKYGDVNPKASWHKLIGLRSDLKTNKPELLLTLRIEDRKSTNLDTALEVRNSLTEDIAKQSDKITPYLHPDEQLIQLGPVNTCYELFLLSITVICIENLHLLLPENLNKDSTVCILYRVLENDVELKPFKVNDKNHLPHEKVIVRIRSSLHMLKHYLQLNPHLSVLLKHENNTIAESLVNLQSLVPADNIQEFFKCTGTSSITLHERCFLTKRDLAQKSIESHLQKSYLDIQLKLQYVETKTDVLHNPDTNMSFNNRTIPNIQYCNEENMSNRCPEVESHRNPSGDFRKCNPISIPGETKCATERKYTNQHFLDCQHLKSQMDKMMCLCSSDTAVCNCMNVKCAGSYHCYCLYISLVAITSVSPKLSGRRIEFRFHHPKAENTSVAHATISAVTGEKSKLQNIGCQFHFISTPNEIKQLLQSFPPKISMYDTNEAAKPVSLLVLDLKPLFHQDKPECQYKLPLYDTDTNKIGDVDVMLKLENRGPHFLLNKETADKNLGPPILDDSLAYKIVDELETWKERQKEMFKAELKKKEERHLNMLSEEWRRQKESLESKLACSVEQCKILANSLNNATEDLRTRRLKSLENETRLIKANENIQWRYEVKLQELRDSSHSMQSDLMSKVSKLEEKKSALEAQVEILMYENESLKLSISKLTNELQMYQKGSLTQDQTASLLQELKVLEEKLNNAQKGKSFFKEQWGKAVREIHRMKVDHQKTMQDQIKNSKEELKNVDLAEILSIDTRALTNDQILLNELQKEIDGIKPRQPFASKEAYGQIFASVNDAFSEDSYNGNKIISGKSDERNERLQALREERDSLLRTGSYSSDDTVIRKLDTEIRSLLVSR
ncbi:PREDICTED: centrosomal protein of 120 kDa-like isoform X3 [Dinoponera quadriceps]|uniref:Centrosomal protein of 120 kDa-like isoform X3 n=1 Tax=Dinoponera quadriceps TaxID=609295 RepID=A0A6P3X8K7_DINQU|nr:PREDICTED: centrosomal protein of 120 kDa-like isoform X3 [Dinoponera quadriceps]